VDCFSQNFGAQKKGKFTKEKLCSKIFFGSNKVHIDLNTTLSLIEV